MTLLPTDGVLLTYLLASFVLAATPGPGVFYIVARSVAHGKRAGLASVAGVAVGNFVNAAAASLGLAMIFIVSATAFNVVKYLGAVYLAYLGITMLRGLKKEPGPASTVPPQRHWRVFIDGVMVASLNPKTALFFSAFLPQFTDTTASVGRQSLVLGAVFVAIAVITDTVYACTAAALAPRLVGARRFQSVGRAGAGVGLIGLAVYSAFATPSRPD